MGGALKSSREQSIKSLSNARHPVKGDTHGCSSIKRFKFKQLPRALSSLGARRHFRYLSDAFSAHQYWVIFWQDQNEICSLCLDAPISRFWYWDILQARLFYLRSLVTICFLKWSSHELLLQCLSICPENVKYILKHLLDFRIYAVHTGKVVELDNRTFFFQVLLAGKFINH